MREWVGCVWVGSAGGWVIFGRGRIFLGSASGTCTVWRRGRLGGKEKKTYLNYFSVLFRTEVVAGTVKKRKYI